MKDLIDFDARDAGGHVEAALYAFEWERDFGFFEPGDEAEGWSGLGWQAIHGVPFVCFVFALG